MQTKALIAERIKELRKELNLTQQELADATGITLKSIRNYENCIREPNSKSMAALERFFNVSGDYLRGETNHKNTVYSYENPEITQNASNSFTFIFNSVLAENKKIFFTILSSLQNVMDIKDEKMQAILLEQIVQFINSQKSLIDKMSDLKENHDKKF